MKAEIESLFEDFDAQADAVIDQVIIADDSAEAAMLASGLAIRLVRWCLGEKASEDEAKVIAASLITELTTLAANMRQEVPTRTGQQEQ